MIHFYFKELIHREVINIKEVWNWKSSEDDKNQSVPVQVNCQLHQIEGKVYLNGLLNLTVESVCSRCLKSYFEQLTISVHEIFTRDHNENMSEEPNIHFIHTELVILDSYLEENIILGLPYIPLCNDTCKGLCSQCGGDLNHQDCNCSVDSTDTRLHKLSDFFKEN